MLSSKHTDETRKLPFTDFHNRPLTVGLCLSLSKPRWRLMTEWQRTEINGESTSMVWPTLGSKTAKERCLKAERDLQRCRGAERKADKALADDCVGRLTSHWRPASVSVTDSLRVGACWVRPSCTGLGSICWRHLAASPPPPAAAAGLSAASWRLSVANGWCFETAQRPSVSARDPWRRCTHAAHPDIYSPPPRTSVTVNFWRYRI